MEELKVKVVEVSQEKERLTIIFVLPLKLTDEK